MTEKNIKRTGYVAIIGRPNVGKSTLINQILGQKLLISSRKPQTTRHQILGIKTEGNTQTIFVDTPGLHLNAEKALNRYMNRAAKSALTDVDVIVFVLEGTKLTKDDEWVFSLLETVDCPVILAINKSDRIKDKTEFFPYLKKYQERFPFKAIVPISAKSGKQVGSLESEIIKLLPEREFEFDEDDVTNRSMRFLGAEIVREKLMRNLGQELPYALTVEIENFEGLEDGRTRVNACIYVEKASHKRIVIGNKGEKLKTIGRDARHDMNALFGKRVHLELWVKVKEGWSDNEHSMRSLGYD